MDDMSNSKNTTEKASLVQPNDFVHLLASAVIKQRRSSFTEGQRNSAKQPPDHLELLETTPLSVSGVHAHEKDQDAHMPLFGD